MTRDRSATRRLALLARASRIGRRAEQYRIGRRAEQYQLISYPRSGSTLCRMYFAALQGRPQPSVYRGDTVWPQSDAITDSLDRLRLVKSHQFDERYRRIVYLVRDGRNAMISHLYLQFLHGGHRYCRSDQVLEGLRHLDLQGHFWGDHLAQAILAATKADVCFIRYEDLVASPALALRKILAFTGYSVSESALAECVAVVTRSDSYRRSPFSGYSHRPAPDSIWAILREHRGGDYWRQILDGRSRRWFHMRGGTPHLIRFGYEGSETWWT